MKKLIIIFLFYLSVSAVFSQQAPDTAFAGKINVRTPEYGPGKGPLVLIDGAHNNFHRANGNFAPLKILLEKDGYNVKSLDSSITEKRLSGCHILVISNALAENNVGRWYMPIYPAFTEEEVKAVKNWVAKGGRLLLIADHMPFAGAANNLANAFGFNYINGFADNCFRCWPPSSFYTKNKSLASPLATGRNENEKIDSVAAFTGSAFSIPGKAIPVLSFSANDTVLITDTAWQINNKTIRQSLEGKVMGALLKTGKGKVAMFGEAAMFTAQLRRNNEPVGFNSPEAPQNIQFILNVFHWLSANLKISIK